MKLRIRRTLLFLSVLAFLAASLPASVRAEDVLPDEFEEISLDEDSDAAEGSEPEEPAEPTARDANPPHGTLLSKIL